MLYGAPGGSAAGQKRLARATDCIRDAIAAATGIPLERISDDDDLIDDLALNPLELEGLGLILDEIFAIRVPGHLWAGPIYRTPGSLAEWCIRASEQAAWAEAQRGPAQRRKG
jgi:hypothetical protein